MSKSPRWAELPRSPALLTHTGASRATALRWQLGDRVSYKVVSPNLSPGPRTCVPEC